MDYKNPGITARVNLNLMTAVYKRDENGFSTNVAHLKTNEIKNINEI
jgi:hypothetical protein